MNWLPSPRDLRQPLLDRSKSDQRTLFDRLDMSKVQALMSANAARHRWMDPTTAGEAIRQVSEHLCLQHVLPRLHGCCSASCAYDGRSRLLVMCSVCALLQPSFQYHAPRAIAVQIAAPASAPRLHPASALAAAIGPPSFLIRLALQHAAGILLLMLLRCQRFSISMPSFRLFYLLSLTLETSSTAFTMAHASHTQMLTSGLELLGA